MTILTPCPISLGEQDAATNDATEDVDVDDNDVQATKSSSCELEEKEEFSILLEKMMLQLRRN